MRKYSIVIPVYNVEEELEVCLDSVTKQTYKNIEIIIINDGSTDSSYEICETYRKKDLRINLISQENAGLSAVRNKGIKLSTGEYILFVDSDDFVELDAVEKFDKAIKNKSPDIVRGNGQQVLLNGAIKKMKHSLVSFPETISGKEFLKNELKMKTFRFVSVLNMYKKSFLTENNLSFKTDMLYEDQLFVPKVLLTSNNMMSTDIVFYNYIEREDSITTSLDKGKSIDSILEISFELEKIYEEVEDLELKKLLLDNLLGLYLGAFYFAGKYNPEKKNLFNKKFVRGKAFSMNNKLKVAFFLISKNLYIKINELTKNSN